ncbi:MAG: hypothetical protein KDK65_02355 [Chlamydiia bacterium]|nr:hypothetical protein [Chlamydiia bacterium]
MSFNPTSSRYRGASDATQPPTPKPKSGVAGLASRFEMINREAKQETTQRTSSVGKQVVSSHKSHSGVVASPKSAPYSIPKTIPTRAVQTPNPAKMPPKIPFRSLKSFWGKKKPAEIVQLYVEMAKNYPMSSLSMKECAEYQLSLMNSSTASAQREFLLKSAQKWLNRALEVETGKRQGPILVKKDQVSKLSQRQAKQVYQRLTPEAKKRVDAKVLELKRRKASHY